MAASKPKYPLGSPQEHIEMCKTHDLPIDMLCEDCDEFICAKCAKTDHKEHDWNTLPTAATQRRRDLLSFLKKIKEEDLPGIDEKLRKIPQQLTKNKELCEADIKKLQNHYDEIITRMSEIREKNEQKLRDNLKERNEKLDVANSEINRKKKEIAEIVQFMEENNSTMSDYGFIDNHRELTKMLSGLDVDIKCNTPSMRYSKGDISEEELEKLVGKSFDLDDISLTETSSFEKAIELVNEKGERKHKYDITANDVCVTDTGEVYFTDSSNSSISCLSPSGSVSKIISTDPLVPGGICQSVDGGLLVTMMDEESEDYELDSHSRRLVRHITMTGDVIHEYEYQEDGQTRLFTVPFRITQNSYSTICVMNSTSLKTGHLVIISPSGRLKCFYQGQNLPKAFWPADVVCDSLCNILVIDMNNIQIHLLSPSGEFLKFLLTDNEVYHPTRLSLCKSTLWVGYIEGLVKVFQY
ncbi:uncharacterized protein LOC134260500 [Saccostrea cucullata]|uniref:uncharacterized protein LOC134260500 n=1 Tax=Saccostrea cuccullata TaxID=36930 RepID=UPI002ED34CCD